MLLKLSSKGQLVLPKIIREQLRLKNGDQFQAKIQDGKIILEPIQTDLLQKLHGKFAGKDFLKELEEEHHGEVEND